MRFFAVVLIASLGAWIPYVGSAQQPPPQQRFRTSVDRVTMNATVRDSRGRPVTNLKIGDFRLLDGGQARTILVCERDTAPMSLALLVDISGSMDVANRRAAARDVARQLLTGLTPGTDRVGLYAFDQALEEVQPLLPAPGNILARMDTLEPWGQTSLFDAIAGTGRHLADSGAARRAVVVLTDGDDNASRLTPEEASSFASSIDVPVYVIVIVSPLDRVGQSASSVNDQRLAQQRDGALGNLARWTGGDILLPVSEHDTTAATRQIVSELRQQYLIAFEPSRQPGWHPLELRTRHTSQVVRARGGYVVPQQPTNRQ